VGASIAGFSLGEQLWAENNEYEVTFVDQRDHFEYWPGTLKQSTDSDIKDQIIVSFTEFTQAYEGKFNFVQGRLVNVRKDDNLIEVTHND
jgi:NADH dehydrogenase FAD-containing subunit